MPADLWIAILDMYEEVVQRLLNGRILTLFDKAFLRNHVRLRLLCATFARHKTLFHLAHLFRAYAFINYMGISVRFNDASSRIKHQTTLNMTMTHKLKILSNYQFAHKLFADVLYSLVLQQVKYDLLNLSQNDRLWYIDFKSLGDLRDFQECSSNWRIF